MKILFVIRSLSHYSYISSVVESLSDHEVELVFDKKWSGGKDASWMVCRVGFFKEVIFFLRELRSYANYIGRNQSVYYLNRWGDYLPFGVRNIVKLPLVKSLLLRCRKAFTMLESLISSDKNVIADIIKRSPDVVVATPLNHRFSNEVEYIKAAKSLKIPTVVIVLSWDNLTTKGVFHEITDKVLVWNETQRQEAINIHGVPESRIKIIGAPFFDKWFGQVLGQSHKCFCETVGISGKPFILYLGSSSKIAKDETWLIQEIYDGIKHKYDMVARPHPANSKHYNNLKGVAVWPKEGSLPEDAISKRDFHNALKYCEFTVGINTSAMVDAIICDKPCLTVLTEKYKATQEQASHFKQLLDAGVLHVRRSVKDGIDGLLNIVDDKKFERSKFIKEFIQPKLTLAGQAAGFEITHCMVANEG